MNVHLHKVVGNEYIKNTSEYHPVNNKIKMYDKKINNNSLLTQWVFEDFYKTFDEQNNKQHVKNMHWNLKY